MRLYDIANFFAAIDRGQEALENGNEEEQKRCLENLEYVNIPEGGYNRKKYDKLKRELTKKVRFKVIK